MIEEMLYFELGSSEQLNACPQKYWIKRLRHLVWLPFSKNLSRRATTWVVCFRDVYFRALPKFNTP